MQIRRTLSWLVAGALVAGLGSASFANSSDTITPLQDPPEMTIGNLQQYAIENIGSNSFVPNNVNRILPSASEATLRDGFTGNASESDISQNQGFDYSDSDDVARVAPEGNQNDGVNSAPYYRQQVTVTTDGPTESVKRVGYCLINSEDTEVRNDNSLFKWYDTVGVSETNDIERNCGFNDDDPTSTGTPDNPRAVISIIYDVQNKTFGLQGSGQHQLAAFGADGLGASWDGQELTVNFAFKPSHALMKQVSGWVIRAAAQDLPDDGQTTYAPQMSQIFWGSDQHTEGEVNSDDASRSNWQHASVGYYGAIVSARENVFYGTLRKGEQRIITGITSGRYIANASSDLWIWGSTDFKTANEISSTAKLDYVSSIIEPEEGEVLFQCSSDGNSLTDPVAVSSSLSYLETGVSRTIDQGNPEAPSDIGDISCSLTYGGGAEFASEIYGNTVVIAIQDAGTAVPTLLTEQEEQENNII